MEQGSSAFLLICGVALNLICDLVCYPVCDLGVMGDPYDDHHVQVACGLACYDNYREYKCCCFPNFDTDHGSYCSSLNCNPHNQLEKEG